MKPTTLLDILAPRSVAILGASENPVKAGSEVADAITQSVAIGGRAAVICSSGFSELGAAGALAQQRLLGVAEAIGAIVADPDIRLVLLYIESPRDAAALAHANDVPILTVKAGRSSAGQATAGGERIGDVLTQPIALQGHAIEARVYAEDPIRFLPSPGALDVFSPPRQESGIWVETGYAKGCRVSSYYDSMLAKAIASAPTRETATAKLQSALVSFDIRSVKTNFPFIDAVLDSAEFKAGQIDTALGTCIAQVRSKAARPASV